MAKPNVISRQELLQSARQVIASHGMQALTLKAVAEGAGVTQGTVYYHFRNKEQLLLELIKEMCQDSWHDLLADLKPRRSHFGKGARFRPEPLYP